MPDLRRRYPTDCVHRGIEDDSEDPDTPRRTARTSARKPDSGKGCNDGEKLLTQRWLGGSFEVTAQTDLP